MIPAVEGGVCRCVSPAPWVGPGRVKDPTRCGRCGGKLHQPVDAGEAPAPGPTLAALERLRQLVGVEVVEVPLAAYAAALELLRDLSAAGERDAEVCGLCDKVPNEEGPGYYPEHTDACPVGRARTVAEALDYADPPAQARGLAQLARWAAETR